MSTIRVLMAGCGTVGSGVVELLQDNTNILRSRTGMQFSFPRIMVKDAIKPDNVDLPDSTFVGTPDELLTEQGDLLVEVMGGTDLARTLVLSALEKGIPVVTANKALVATHGKELFKTARKNNTCIFFESSCCAGTPTISALQRGMVSNEIDSIIGIVNGTCNFILTEMENQGQPYSEALAQAQELGFAEADPTLDVNGADSAHKLSIMASLAFDRNITINDVPHEGVENIQLSDLMIARSFGYVCKLLAVGFCSEEGISVAVHPTLVPAESPLAQISGPNNALLISGDAFGPLLLTGAGAGSLPTASGVVADIVSIVSGAGQKMFDMLQNLNDRTDSPTLIPLDDVEYRYFVSCMAPADTAVTRVSQAFQSHGIELESVSRGGEAEDPSEPIPVVAITCPVTGKKLTAALAELGQNDDNIPPTMIRILELYT